MEKFVIGLDFGTDSVRGLLVETTSGEILSTSVSPFQRWKKGLFCDPQQLQFRQHPLDYIESMEFVLKGLLEDISETVRQNIVGLSVDTTGSTPVAINENCIPLALMPEFSECPDAMFILWKDHTASAESEEINNLSHQWTTDYTRFSGGSYSSEWFWSKIWHVSRKNKNVAKKAYSWIEHCDWIPALLTGQTDPLKIKRSRCAAGHKAMWHRDFNGFPDAAFWETLDPYLATIRKRLPEETFTSNQVAGIIAGTWAEKLNLPGNMIVSVGGIDAHFGAVGSCIEPYTMAKIIGTSTCDMVIVPNEKHNHQIVKGICGQVDGSIIPGMLGLEAGQSAFGDLYNWFTNLLLFPVRKFLSEKISSGEIDILHNKVLSGLSEFAKELPVTENDILASDWINGRRTPDLNPHLKSTITGLQLGSDAPQIFKALAEATAFGSKAILQRFLKEGIPINKVLASGGIARKSPYIMQTLSNVLNRTISVVKSEQVCALGATMFAATASGVYKNIQEAQKAMSSGIETEYNPQQNKIGAYGKLYEKYMRLEGVQ